MARWLGGLLTPGGRVGGRKCMSESKYQQGGLIDEPVDKYTHAHRTHKINVLDLCKQAR